MAEIILQDIRIGTDVHMLVTLTDSGVAISWDSVDIQQLFAYSEPQRAFAGNCTYVIDEEDATKLHVTYPAAVQKLLGKMRLVAQVNLLGNVATYDAFAFSIVKFSDDDEDPTVEEIEVPLAVEAVNTTIMYEILRACQAATAAANEAKEGADEAADAATAAAAAANSAADAANSAAEAATAAKEAADLATAAANAAADSANSAAADATAGAAAANSAAAAATAAKEAADRATTAANSAAAAATSAANSANAAASAATTATTNANAATAAANSAATAANSAAAAATAAKEAADLATAAATAAAAAANAAAARVETAIENAAAATTAANSAAAAANSAAEAASTAAAAATAAKEAADLATTAANTAAAAANEAAQNCQQTVAQVGPKLEPIMREYPATGDNEQVVRITTDGGDVVAEAAIVDSGEEQLAEVIDDFGKRVFAVTPSAAQVKGLKYVDGSEFYQAPLLQRYGLDEVMVQWCTPFAILTKHSVRELLIWGWTDGSGNYGVSSYDPRTQEIKRTVVGATASVDMHNSPAVIELPDGRIGVISSRGHNESQSLWASVSTNPGDISAFDPAVEVTGFGGRTTYVQIHYIGGVFYVFTRVYNLQTSIYYWKMITSSDFTTWAAPISIVTAGVQYYVRFVKVAGRSNILRMVMYSNPNYNSMDIRLGYLDVSTGYIYSGSVIPGNKIGTWGDTLLNTAFSVIIAKPTTHSQRLMDVAVTGLNNVVVVFSRWTDAYDSIYYVYQNGTIIPVCNGGEAYLHSRAQLGARFVDADNVAVARNDVDTATDYAEVFRLMNGEAVKIIDIDKLQNGADHRRIHMPMADEDGKFLFYAKGTFDTSDYTIFDSDIMFVKLFN